MYADASLPKHSTGLRGSTDSGVSIPMSRTRSTLVASVSPSTTRSTVASSPGGIVGRGAAVVLDAAAVVELAVPPVVAGRALVVDRAGSEDVSVEREDDPVDPVDPVVLSSCGRATSRPPDEEQAASDDTTAAATANVPSIRPTRTAGAYGRPGTPG
jgi:hypothetical protein